MFIEFSTINIVALSALGYGLGRGTRALFGHVIGARPVMYKLVLYGLVPMLVFIFGRQLLFAREYGLTGDWMLTYLYIITFFLSQMAGLMPSSKT